MSQWRGRFDADSDWGIAMEWLSKWYHVPTILVLVLFMFWTRARTWGAFVSDGSVVFSGNDPWYHLREVTYVTRNWPSTMPYDVWTNYPTGTSVSQFGTIFDQVIATVALIVGLGDPSQQTVRLVLLFAPPAVGALMAVPTYYLGKRLSGKLGGVIAVLLLALSSGELLRRSLVGFADHHVAEAFTQALAVLAIVVALQVADREKPVWELFVDRDLAALRRPVGYAALAGVGTSLYIWTWPPGTLLLGILGIYFTLQLSLSHVRGDSPEPVAIAGTVLFAVVTVLTLLPLDTVGYEATSFSLLQPTLAAAGAAWCVLLGAASRVWDRRDYPVWTYPLAALGVIAVGIGLLALVAPSVFNLIVVNAQRVFVPGSTGGAGTVGEVQPLPIGNAAETFFSWFGLAVMTAVVGAFVALGQALISEEPRSELLLLPLWLLTMVLATLTQQRFAYYLTVPVVVLTAYTVGMAFDYVRSASSDSDDGIETYQVLAVLTVIMLLIVPMFAATTTGARSEPANVFNQSDANHNGVGGFTGWQSSLEWMDENTPDEGTFAGTDNRMDPYATNAKTSDYDYPEGSYGVLSWWDYGHWITAASDRIPVANPFQQSATEAAQFLLAENESRADEVIGQMSDGDNRETRYVMVDWQMATPASKFSAPPAFVEGKNFSDYVRYVPLNQQRQGFFLFTQDYYDTMVNRLYRYHGSAQRPQAVVTRYGQSAQVSGVLQTFFRNGSTYGQRMAAAREAINGTPNAQIGGFGPYPSERVPALEHYRLVQTSDRSLNPVQVTHPQLIDFYRGGPQIRNLLNQLGLGYRQTFGLSERNPQWTKVFERVDGATIEGTGPANATVQAAVQMNMPNANNTFRYTQQAQTDADGSFTMTVPYSTTGYDEYGPDDGYTNTSVRATGSYEFNARTPTIQNGSLSFEAYNATVDVPESAVVENGTVSVELTEIETGGQGSTGSLAGPSAGEAAQPRTDTAG